MMLGALLETEIQVIIVILDFGSTFVGYAEQLAERYIHLKPQAN